MGLIKHFGAALFLLPLGFFVIPGEVRPKFYFLFLLRYNF